ncbi:MAG: nitronate monooxygenase [Anaerolineae bacterium]|nr:nitronate monooxygenase [Anaerolineae bacterium]
MLRTPLTEWLNLKHPIVQAGMAWAATWELVVAVARAGALGVLGAGNAPTEWVHEQITRVRAAGVGMFGLNVPLFSPFTEQVVQLAAEERVPVVTTGAGNPTPHIAVLKAAGTAVIPVVASSAQARRFVSAGADALIAEGMEAGGHVGDVTTLALLPQVVDSVDVPVIAAGGFADGRGLVAALALGASGIQMGTRFVCTEECIAHPAYKEAILRAHERSTMVTGHSIGHPVRCIRNPLTRAFEALEKQGATREELLAFGTGRFRRAILEGDVLQGSVMAGQGSGLIRDIVPAAKVIHRTIQQAESLLQHMQTLKLD